MERSEIARISPSHPPKIFIACDSCKSRKRRCDGGLPKCAGCISHNVECNYVASRRTRGPGKRERYKECLGQTQLALPSGRRPGSSDLETTTEVPLAILANPSTNGSSNASLEHTTSSTGLLEARASPSHRFAIFSRFLLPDQFAGHFNPVKTNAEEAVGTRRFTKLMPSFITRRLIENTFAEIMADHQLLKLSDFVALLEAQYKASIDDPDGNPSRWAMVNAVIALAIRAKTAPGSEAIVSDITYGYYRNATIVISELVIGDATLLSVQAFLAMAIFAQGISDTRAAVMLASNASRHLDLLCSTGLSTGRVLEGAEVEECVRLCRIAKTFDIINGPS